MEPMTDEQIDALAYVIPLLKGWVSAIEEELKARLLEGAEFQNVSLVPTRATRKWEDPIGIIETLKGFADLDVVAPRTPLSPAQAEKKLGRSIYQKDLSKHVVQESSGTSLKYRSSTD